MAVLRKANWAHPGDFWLNEALGTFSRNAYHQYDDALHYYRVALALRPRNVHMHYDVADLWLQKGAVEEAIAEFSKMVELDPSNEWGFRGRARNYHRLQKYDNAIADYQKAIALHTIHGWLCADLGHILCYQKNEYDEAIACFRKAIELDPKLTWAYQHLGRILGRHKRDYDGAIACFRKAIALDPKHAMAHVNLGVALSHKGDLDGAIAEFREAIRLDPEDAAAQTNLRIAQRMRELLPRLSEVLAGKDKPKSPAEGCEFGRLCGQPFQKRYAEAVRRFAEAFAADPNLAADLTASHRYNAACYAALAAAGQGADAATIDAQERTRLRRRALAWLRADLARYAQLVENRRGQAGGMLQRRLRHWQQDRDLAGLRDPAALGKLPAEERAACRKLWADVATLLTPAETQPAKEDKESGGVPGVGKGLEKKGEDQEEAAKAKQAAEYLRAGKQDLALPLLVEIAKLKTDRLGSEHPDTLASMNQLGVVYWQMGQLDKSVPLFEKLLKLRVAKLGRDRPETLRALANLGVNYKDAGRLQEAIPLLEEAHRAKQKNTDLAWVTNPLLDAYARAGEHAKLAKLAKLLQEEVSAARKALPKDSPELGGLLAQLGLARLQQKQWAEAEPPLRESLAIRAKAQPDAWTTFNVKSLLGGALLGQKQYAEGEPLLLAGYAGMKQREKSIPLQAKVRLAAAVERLVQLYEALGQQDEVARWTKEREALHKKEAESQ
jgi:tetratricopeptide (TPR) repeat protein